MMTINSQTFFQSLTLKIKLISFVELKLKKIKINVKKNKNKIFLSLLPENRLLMSYTMRKYNLKKQNNNIKLIMKNSNLMYFKFNSFNKLIKI